MGTAKSTVAVNYDDFLGFVNRMKSVYTYQSFIPTSSALMEWYRALKDLTLDKLNRAFDLYTRTNSNPPTVAQLRECANTITDTQQFNEAEYFGEHTYWVLEDLNGYYINECISQVPMDGEDVRKYFISCGYDMSGTKLFPTDFRTYRPKYAERTPWAGDKDKSRRTTREEVQSMFADIQRTFSGIEVELDG